MIVSSTKQKQLFGFYGDNNYILLKGWGKQELPLEELFQLFKKRLLAELEFVERKGA